MRSLVYWVCVLVGLLLFRLIYLQLIEYHRFQTLSLKNQMSIIPVAAPRGIIVDRNGVVLADNTPVYSLELIPEHIKNLTHTLAALQTLMPSITNDDLKLFHRLRRQNRPFVPITLKLKLSQEDIARFAVNQYQFPGAQIKAESLRYYPLAEETAHVLGYVGRINPEELKTLDPKIYQSTQFIGKTGIEGYYEQKLHGKMGFQHVETDVNGRVVRVLNKIPSQAGEKLKLTLDVRLQHIAYEALGENHGAVVLIDPKTGEILVMVSKPAFNPNQFVGGISSQQYHHLSTATERPLFNRAVRGLYPPASTLKPYIGLTALNANVVNLQTTIYDPGWYRLPGVSHVYHDWYKPGHGVVDLKRAVTVSCDPYFYHLGHMLGIHTMHQMITQFGFGQLTHIDLREEAPGIVPSATWKEKTHHLPWYPGDSLITAIGQGFMLVSPLQMAVAVGTLAEKGHRIKPHLLYTTQADNTQENRYQPQEAHHIVLNDPHYWEVIHDAMHQVTTSPEGTGYRFGRNPPYPVAAKTGTAQVFGGKAYMSRLHQALPQSLRDHSLFIAFTPVDSPEVAIAVIVEHDVIASQIARQVLDAYHALYHPGLS